MADKHSNTRKYNDLRRRAQALLADQGGPVSYLSPEGVRRAIEALHTHQIELELQNEELRLAQEEIIATRDRYSDLYDFSPVGYATVNDRGFIIEANLTLAAMLVVERQDQVRTPLSAVIVDEDKSTYYLHRRELLDTRSRRICELRLRKGDNSVFWARVEGIAVGCGDSGVNTRFAIIDITERKKAEHERQRLEDQLRQSQKLEAIGLLAGGIAHDFNNILAAILGNAELLKTELASGGDEMLYVDEVIKSANRAGNLTRQLLAFARKGKRQVTPFDMHNVLTRTAEMLSHAIDRRIEIRLDLHASPSTVMGDPMELQNALLNLGVNARDAMVDGGVLTYATGNVSLTEADCDEHPLELTPGEFLEVRIIDTGTGMDEQTQKKIFEPFFTTKEVGKGTGLGLAGVYGCIRSHNGSVRVSSEPGSGSTFTILLPMTGAPVEAADRNAVGDEFVKGTGHVLVVDDDEAVRNFVSTSLKSLGYTVSLCADGVEGVECYRRRHREIDMVILDLIMPKMNGLDAFRKMKEINPNVKVLVSSGFSHTQATHQMLAEGALTLLNKPFQMAELSQEVADHIQCDSQQ